MIRGYCSACGASLNEYFPKDFPDRFKLCCICFDVAWLSVSCINKPEKIVGLDEHIKICSYCREIISEKHERVLKKITVMG